MDFYQNYKQNIDAISLCLDKGLIFPALTLIYSSIDVAAWMAFGDIKVETRFINWIDRWMYKNGSLDATSTDLYGARCSILHTLTPDSNLSKNGKANIVVYAWGKANLNDIKEVSAKRGTDNQSFVHVNELYDIYRDGIDNFLDSLETDKDLKDRFNKRIELSYENISNDEMQSYRDNAN